MYYIFPLDGATNSIVCNDPAVNPLFFIDKSFDEKENICENVKTPSLLLISHILQEGHINSQKNHPGKKAKE